MERDFELSTFRRVASWIEIAFAFLLLLVGGLLMVASISDPSSDPHGALGGGGVVALMAAAADLGLVRLLIEGRADVRLGTVKSVTPLMLAAGLANKMDRPTKKEYSDALEIAKLLVEKGADVNAVGENGWTPLHGAAYVGDDEFVQFLVDRGCHTGCD